jgi:hypothetical protein
MKTYEGGVGKIYFTTWYWTEVSGQFHSETNSPLEYKVPSFNGKKAGEASESMYK